jgi:hypothetical protein
LGIPRQGRDQSRAAERLRNLFAVRLSRHVSALLLTSILSVSSALWMDFLPLPQLLSPPLLMIIALIPTALVPFMTVVAISSQLLDQLTSVADALIAKWVDTVRPSRMPMVVVM